MKVYRFIFIVGFLNLIIPFLGVPFVYKNYVLLAIAAVTIGYALIVRAIEKEKELISHNQKEIIQSSQKTIEEVVDMVEVREHIVMSDVIPKRRGRKSKIVVQEQIYE